MAEDCGNGGDGGGGSGTVGVPEQWPALTADALALEACWEVQERNDWCGIASLVVAMRALGLSAIPDAAPNTRSTSSARSDSTCRSTITDTGRSRSCSGRTGSGRSSSGWLGAVAPMDQQRACYAFADKVLQRRFGACPRLGRGGFSLLELGAVAEAYLASLQAPTTAPLATMATTPAQRREDSPGGDSSQEGGYGVGDDGQRRPILPRRVVVARVVPLATPEAAAAALLEVFEPSWHAADTAGGSSLGSQRGGGATNYDGVDTSLRSWSSGSGVVNVVVLANYLGPRGGHWSPVAMACRGGGGGGACNSAAPAGSWQVAVASGPASPGQGSCCLVLDVSPKAPARRAWWPLRSFSEGVAALNSRGEKRGLLVLQWADKPGDSQC